MARPSNTGTRIRERRMTLGLRQADLARACGISASYLNLIEHNKRGIAGKLLAAIAAQLGVDHADLVQGADQSVIGALVTAGLAHALPDAALARAEALARGFPEWAGVIGQQRSQIARLERSIDALTDRLTHDPALAEAMHEVLSTVAAVRSTASILASTPGIDRNWLGRFHKNLDQDSRRLAEGAEAMVAYFERQADRGDGFSTPLESVTAYLDMRAADLAGQLDPAGIDALCADGPRDAGAQALLRTRLEQIAADTAALPAATVTATGARTNWSPLAMAQETGTGLDRIMRRLATLPADCGAPDFGVIVADSAGATLYRRALDGFVLPVVASGCPLWPLYQSLARPHYPVDALLQMPDGAAFAATAIALPAGTAGTAEVYHATMLVRRADTPTAPAGAPPVPVGATCRVCPRPLCTARREPSVLASPGPARDLI